MYVFTDFCGGWGKLGWEVPPCHTMLVLLHLSRMAHRASANLPEGVTKKWISDWIVFDMFHYCLNKQATPLTLVKKSFVKKPKPSNWPKTMQKTYNTVHNHIKHKRNPRPLPQNACFLTYFRGVVHTTRCISSLGSGP